MNFNLFESTRSCCSAEVPVWTLETSVSSSSSKRIGSCSVQMIRPPSAGFDRTAELGSDTSLAWACTALIHAVAARREMPKCVFPPHPDVPWCWNQRRADASPSNSRDLQQAFQWGNPTQTCKPTADRIIWTNGQFSVSQVPSLCRVQLVETGSDEYPQVLDSKLHEPGRSWLWARTAPVRDGKVKEEVMARMNHHHYQNAEQRNSPAKAKRQMSSILSFCGEPAATEEFASAERKEVSGKVCFQRRSVSVAPWSLQGGGGGGGGWEEEEEEEEKSK